MVEDESSEDNEVKCPELTDCDVDSLGCEHGLKQDESGCDTCACHICGPVCLMRCEHGFTMDKRNCSQCRCADGKFDQEKLAAYELCFYRSSFPCPEIRNSVSKARVMRSFVSRTQDVGENFQNRLQLSSNIFQLPMRQLKLLLQKRMIPTTTLLIRKKWIRTRKDRMQP